jgi:hypothetical protein
MVRPPTGHEWPGQQKSAIRRLGEKWRVYRERKKRLNAARTSYDQDSDKFRHYGQGGG